MLWSPKSRNNEALVVPWFGSDGRPKPRDLVPCTELFEGGNLVLPEGSGSTSPRNGPDATAGQRARAERPQRPDHLGPVLFGQFVPGHQLGFDSNEIALDAVHPRPQQFLVTRRLGAVPDE